MCLVLAHHSWWGILNKCMFHTVDDIRVPVQGLITTPMSVKLNWSKHCLSRESIYLSIFSNKYIGAAPAKGPHLRLQKHIPEPLLAMQISSNHYVIVQVFTNARCKSKKGKLDVVIWLFLVSGSLCYMPYIILNIRHWKWQKIIHCNGE